MGYRVGNIDLLFDRAENQSSNRFWTLVYVRSGSGMYMAEGRLCTLNESDMLFFPPRAQYSFVSEDLGDEYNISIDAVIFHFDERWIDCLLKVFPSYSHLALCLKEMNSVLSVSGTKWYKVSTILSSMNPSDPEKMSLDILTLLFLLSEPSDLTPVSSQIEYNESDISEKVARIDRYISCNLHNKIALEDISRYVGMNKSYFCLFFKKHYGVSMIDYLNGLRVQKAIGLLKSTRMQVSDIAAECGFPTVTYFNRIFRKVTGQTPSQCRKSK